MNAEQEAILHKHAVAATHALTAINSLRKPKELLEIEADHRRWLTTMLPVHFRGIDQFAKHHDDYWNNVWSIPLDKKPPANIACWNRGGMKSTSAEATAIALAAKELRSFGL